MLRLLKHKSRKRGFTLLEAIVSILILGTALGAMLLTFMTGRVSIAMAKHHTEAMNHARAAIEQYINNGTTTYNWPGDSDIESLGGSCNWDITPYADYERVVVTISWNERTMGSNRQLSEQLVTFVAQ